MTGLSVILGSPYSYGNIYLHWLSNLLSYLSSWLWSWEAFNRENANNVNRERHCSRAGKLSFSIYWALQQHHSWNAAGSVSTQRDLYRLLGHPGLLYAAWSLDRRFHPRMLIIFCMRPRKNTFIAIEENIYIWGKNGMKCICEYIYLRCATAEFKCTFLYAFLLYK